MSLVIDHLMIVPVVLPLVAGASMLLLSERRRTLKAAINIASTFTLVAVAIALLRMADAPLTDATQARVGVYLLGDWPAPFGIVLVVDRLSALMLLLTSTLASASAVFALARWDRAGAHFHSLFQFLLMGLNGAFLTSHSAYADVPLIGAVPLVSALLFDLGVFLLVIGATVLMLIALAHQSVRSHRVRGGREPEVMEQEVTTHAMQEL